MFEVRVSDALAEQITERWGPHRSSRGSASEYDFWAGPLQAAIAAFRTFDDLAWDLVPAVRTYILVDPVFGALVFAGVLSGSNVVDLVAVGEDRDYWGCGGG